MVSSVACGSSYGRSSYGRTRAAQLTRCLARRAVPIRCVHIMYPDGPGGFELEVRCKNPTVLLRSCAQAGGDPLFRLLCRQAVGRAGACRSVLAQCVWPAVRLPSRTMNLGHAIQSSASTPSGPATGAVCAFGGSGEEWSGRPAQPRALLSVGWLRVVLSAAFTCRKGWYVRRLRMGLAARGEEALHCSLQLSGRVRPEGLCIRLATRGATI